MRISPLDREIMEAIGAGATLASLAERLDVTAESLRPRLGQLWHRKRVECAGGLWRVAA